MAVLCLTTRGVLEFVLIYFNFDDIDSDNNTIFLEFYFCNNRKQWELLLYDLLIINNFVSAKGNPIRN